ncbi:MAG: lysophospholipid acyltransferase family protein [Longimicrobiales bacterium]
MEKKEFRFQAAGLLGRALLGVYFPLVRCTREGAENFQDFRRRKEPVIFVFWHGQLLPLIHFHRNEGIVVLVSDHADGEYVTRVILRHGFGAARGSSTRGGVKGMKGILRAIRAGQDLAFTPDGPRGPRHVFKWGALTAAQLSGAPVIPVGVGADRAWYLGSWDRFMIPKPLSSLRIRYGHPRRVPRDSSEEEMKRIAADLETELRQFTLELNPAEDRIRKELHAES